MFGRGNWAIVGLAKESLEAFRTSLEDRPLMVASSQMAASAVTRQFEADAVGINPFGTPRLDEEHPLELDHQEELARFATSDQEARSTSNLAAEILDCEGYGVTVEQFQLHATMPWYGLWAVSNEWKDVAIWPPSKSSVLMCCWSGRISFCEHLTKRRLIRKRWV